MPFFKREAPAILSLYKPGDEDAGSKIGRAVIACRGLVWWSCARLKRCNCREPVPGPYDWAPFTHF